MNQFQKRIKTVCLVLVWVCLGLFLEVTGPTLIDLKIRIQADYEQMAFALSGRSVGFFIGSVIGGILVDRFVPFCDLMIGVCLTGGAIATVFVPFSPVVELLWFIIMVQGTFEGVINVAGQKLILNLWKEDAASPLQILHGGFGIGSFIISLVSNPFLAIAKSRNNQSVINGSTNGITLNTSLEGVIVNGTDPVEYIRESSIEISYVIAAIITLCLSTVFYTYHIRGQCHYKDDRASSSMKTMVVVRGRNGRSRRQEVVENLKTMFNPATCAGGRFFYGIQIFTLLFLFCVNIIGGDQILGKFIRVYSIEQLGFTVSEGSYINSVFWISVVAGRIIGFIAARYIPIRMLILIETGGVLISTILLNVFASTNVSALWVLTAFLGLFHAQCFPSGIAWGDFHIEMTGIALTFLLFGASIGGIAYLQLTGFLFKTYGPTSFLYQIMGNGIAAFTIAILLDVVGARHGSRFEPVNTEPGKIDLEDKLTDNKYLAECKH